ncbi:MAG: ribonuclease R [Pseudanabaenaceae cyanobacterium bins.68]|nr:ribonuclease R [Pseudanabaenaceae cyanobacterium bins.68]
MEFSISQVLENFNDDKLVAPKLIEKKIGITSETQAQQLQIALDALAKVGILVKDKGRYKRSETEQLVEGKLRCSSKGFCFAIQETEGAEDIYIRESDLSNAWNGDRVLVKVTKDGVRRRSPEGEVRLITERANPTLLAKVKSESETSVRAVPLDDRLLFEIELVEDPEHQDLTLAMDKLIHLEMVRYPLANQLPKAKIVKILGDDPESTADIDLVCCKYNLPREFSGELLAEAAGISAQSDLPRRDLTDLPVVIIGEHPGISLEPIEQGWRLGVHIPDLASYVAVDSLLDQAAKQRLRSFFLGENMTIPLFPPLPILAQSQICTISVIMELDQIGDLLGFEIYPAEVKVTSRLTYDQAENQAEHDPQLAQLLQAIATLSAQLQQQRQGIGAIGLAQLSWSESDEGLVGVPVFLKSRPLQGRLCELMILANRAIATHIAALGLPGIFRTQAPPELNQLQEWGKLVASMGIELNWGDPDKIQSQDLQQALDLIDGLTDSHRIDILKYLLYELLLPGEYSEVKGSHFGLGMVDRAYVHGVSPQHRYADLITQRLLHLVFKEGRDRRSSRSKEGVDLCSSKCHGQVSWSVLPPEPERQIRAEIEQFCSKLNQQDLIFRKGLTDLDGLRKAEVMASKVGESFYGIITSVQSYGFFVQIEALMAEGLVHVSSLKDDWYEFPQTNNKGKGKQSQPTLLVGRRSGRQYCLGDRILVEVKSVDYYRQQIDLVAAVSAVGDDSFGHSPVEPEHPEPDQLSDQLAERFTQKTWGRSLDLLPEHEQAGE